MTRRLALLLALLGLGLARGAQAGAPTADCYAFSGVAARAPAPAVELFVLIDETTVLDDRLKQLVFENAARFLKPGDAIAVARFSAFIQGRYTDVAARGVLDPRLGEEARYDTPRSALAKLDPCLAAQRQAVRHDIGTTLKTLLDGADNAIARSDVMGSLKTLSAVVRDSPAGQKVVLVVSDMLENSQTTSFYAANAVRRIEPKAELAKAARAGLQADFGGARLYVIGAGLMPAGPRAADSYRAGPVMSALEEFWTQWFAASGARLVEFGKPALVGQVE